MTCERREKDFLTSSTEDRIIALQKRLDHHSDEFDRHVKDEEIRWNKLLSVTESNATAIEDLAASTKGVVDAWQTSTNVGRFVKWLSGFAVIGAAYTWWTKL